MRESEIERYFNWAVQRLGGRTYKFHSPNNRGVSDRIACLPGGETWFVELKAPRGRLSPLQRVFAQDMEHLGQNYACLWSKERVDEWAHTITNTTQKRPHGCGN
jgi:hypothetical protein